MNLNDLSPLPPGGEGPGVRGFFTGQWKMTPSPQPLSPKGERGFRTLGGAPRCALCALLLLVLAGGAIEDWVRKGNAAFERGDYEAALAYYSTAEERILDPGLAAFNKAAALYQLGDYARAAEHYACALEDAQGVRRAKALYGFGNARVQLGRAGIGKQAVEQLLLAIRSYQDCLKDETQLGPAEREACGQTFQNARRNLRLAEAILVKKKAERQSDASTGSDSSKDSDSGTEPDANRAERGPDGRSPTRAVRPKGKPVDPGEGADADQHPPGAGNLPTNVSGAMTLDAGQALDYLQETMQRLRRDRARALGAVIENGAGVRDW